MEEEALSRRSVAELAGRFKGSTCPHDAAGIETEKPVRRRPPRSLQLSKAHPEQPPGVTSPLPTKAKRNSALIEKLQANLSLSPTTLLPSPKSPGFKLLPPPFTPPSPGCALVSGFFSATPPASPLTATGASPWTEEEGPASFEAPPTVEEGSVLSNTNIKERARHSIRRRPPSRRHRKSSNGDEVGVAMEGGEVSPSSPTEPEDKTTTTTTTTTTGGGDETDTSTCLQKNKEEEDESKSVETRGDEEMKEGSKGGEEGS